MCDSLYVIEHDYTRETRENSAWFWIDGYLHGRNRDRGFGYTLSNMEAWESTYYLARAFMSGYREGIKEPYVGKIKATYYQKKKWQETLLQKSLPFR